MKNLPRIKMYSFVSLDGYAAGTDGTMEWLTDNIHDPYKDCDFAGFCSGMSYVLMSGIYYATLQAADVWPFGDKPCFIVSPLDMGTEPGRKVEYLLIGSDRGEYLTERIMCLREHAGGDIWLAGDNILISSLMDMNLIDELIVNIVPVMIGSGCRLMNGAVNKSAWILTECNKFNNDIIQLKYKRRIL